jgi:hypothetical protein
MTTSKPLFYEFTTIKKYGVPSRNFVTKMFSAKKVTKLPDLTVPNYINGIAHLYFLTK